MKEEEQEEEEECETCKALRGALRVARTHCAQRSGLVIGLGGCASCVAINAALALPCPHARAESEAKAAIGEAACRGMERAADMLMSRENRLAFVSMGVRALQGAAETIRAEAEAMREEVLRG